MKETEVIMEQQATVNTAPIEQMLEHLDVNSVFGKPLIEGDTMMIPVAQVVYGFGYGGGFGRGPNGHKPSQENTQEATNGEMSGGSGVGAGGRATPRGYVRMTPQEVKYEPIIDSSRISLAGILMVAWSVFWITATIRVIAKAIAKRKSSPAF
jgi:uncharacterized spore protein YtfJ